MPYKFPDKQLASPRYTEHIKHLNNSYNLPSAGNPFKNFLKNLRPPKIPGGSIGPAVLIEIGLELAFPEPTANEDEILKRLQESPKEIQPAQYKFTGGQGNGIPYRITINYINQSDVLTSATVEAYGPIGEISLPISNFFGAPRYNNGHPIVRIDALCRGPYGGPGSPLQRSGIYTLGDPFITLKKLESIVITRWDGQPDTSGNPPPTQAPIITNVTNNYYPPILTNRDKNDRSTPPYEYKIPKVAPFKIPDDFTIPDSYSDNLPDFNPASDPITNPPKPHLQPPVAPANIPTPNPDAGVTAPKVFTNNPPDQAPFAPIPNAFSPTVLNPTVLNPVTIKPTVYQGPEKGFQITYNKTTGEPEIKLPETKETVTPTTEKTDTQKILDKLDALKPDNAIETSIQLIGIKAVIDAIASNTTPQKLEDAAAAGTCRTTQPGGCTTNLMNNVVGNINSNTNGKIDGLGLGNAFANAEQLRRLGAIDDKLGPLMPGGLSSGMGRLSKFLGIDRIFNLLNFLAILHNASMLSASLKVTLLETLSSVGNATGLLQTSEGDNVDLNQVFNQGVEGLVVSLIGAEAWASMKLTWRKYSSIYRAATNSLNAVSSMFNSIGQAVETAAEYTGKLGNAVRAAGVVRENAYNYMSEKFEVRNSNKYISFQSSVGNTIQVLETVNEIAENIVEGQQQYTEAVKATADFQKQLSEAQKNPGIDNKAVKEEAEKIKANLVKDPTGEDEEGLLSFLTD